MSTYEEAIKNKHNLNPRDAKTNASKERRDPVQELEDQIAQEQDFDKRQGLVLQLRELRLERQLRVKDLEDRLRQGGRKVDDSDPEKQEIAEREKRAAEEKKQLMGQAKSLIDSGMAPQQVGQMLMGLPVTASSTGMPAVQGLTVADALKIVDLVVERKNEGELKALIVSLQREIDALKKGGGGSPPTPQSPIAFAKEQAEVRKAWIDALKAEGVPIGEAARGSGDEPIESLKEKYRHEEKMHELGTERNYKEGIVTALGDIVERAGRGAAHQYLEEGGPPEEPAGKGELDSFTCSTKDCGAKVFAPPDAPQLTCPKCGTVYTRKPK